MLGPQLYDKGPSGAISKPGKDAIVSKIIYHMLKEQTPYRERSAEDYLHKDQERQLRLLRKQAKSLGFTLVPQTSP